MTGTADHGDRVRPARRDLGSVGFATRSDVYERGRPGYPTGVIDLLGRAAGLGPGCRVVDVGAGTGKLTRQLVATGARCVAVEPSAAMREIAGERAAGAGIVAGSAEALPLAASTFDLLTVAQAFHWFEPDRALAEMARVLRPGAVAALVWNERDESVPWVADLGRIMLGVDNSVHLPAAAFESVLSSGGHFGRTSRHAYPFTVPLSREGLVDLVASRSYVNVLADPERQALLDEVRMLAAGLDEPLAMAYVAEVIAGRRTDSSGP